MVQLRVEPYRLEYQGYDADRHTAEAIYIGQSIQGTARVYNALVNWHFTGRPVHPLAQGIKVHVGPPRDGSLLYILYLMMVHGKLPVYPELCFELAGLAIPLWLKAIIARRSGQNKEVEKAVDAMLEMYKMNTEYAKQVQADHMHDKAFLYALLEKLAVSSQKPLADMAAPIGRTVKQIEHFSGSPEPVVVDEPIAEALRSKEEAIVGDTQTMTGRIVAVDKDKGTGKLHVDGESSPTRAKITDPTLAVAENAYTHALDTEARVSVTAKPVSKGGSISTLYISDAKIISED